MLTGAMGVQGALPPAPNKDWPAVSGAALSAPTRTGRCKKILYHITVLGFFLVPYFLVIANFLAAFAARQRAFPPPTPPPLAFFGSGAWPPTPPPNSNLNPPINPILTSFANVDEVKRYPPRRIGEAGIFRVYGDRISGSPRLPACRTGRRLP